MRTRRSRALVAVLAAVVVASCGDAPTGPPPDDELSLEIISGDGQSGVPGWALDQELVVRVTNHEGVPVAGVGVRFQAAGGGFTGAVVRTSSALGLASTTWTLGAADGPPQTVTASFSGSSATIVFEATALGPDESDLLVVRGTLGPMTGIVLANPGTSLQVVGLQRAADTLYYLPPDLPAGTAVVLFGATNRPLMEIPAWTPGVDTLEVFMLPPVSVDIDFHVRTGNFDSRRAIMVEQLENTRRVWATEGAGIVLGEVTFEDDTDPTRDIHKSSSGICSGLTLGEAIQIDVVTSIDNGSFTGWGCWAGQIYLGDGTERFPYLTAHEIGHTFTLEHTATGMMFPNQPGTVLREGEIFRAHFHRSSVLNTIFAGQPEAFRQNCSSVPSPCLPETLDIGAGLIAQTATRPSLLHSLSIGAPVDAVVDEHRGRH